MKKILLIQTAFLGDVILATPLIENLHASFPEIQLDFLVKKGNEPLLLDHPKLNKVYVFDKGKKWKSMLQLIQQFRKEKYDYCINLHRFGSSGILTIFSGAQQKIGFDKNPFSFLFSKKYPHILEMGTHEVDRNLQLIQTICEATNRQPRLYPTPAAFEKISIYQEEAYYCIAPASVWFTKQAPVSKWVELCQEVKGKIYILGAPNDKELADEIREKSNREYVINLCGELSIMESAALMKGAKRNFVNDSGPLHLASAMNAPVSAFFCSTVPDFGFGPLSEDAKVVEVKNLACKPCGLHGHRSCPKQDFRCGNELSVKEAIIRDF